MLTHGFKTHGADSTSVGRRTRWRTRSIVTGTVAALGLSLLAAVPATADPERPVDRLDEAQQAWLDSSHRAAALNEEVLVAQEAAAAATGQVATASEGHRPSRDAATAAAEAAARGRRRRRPRTRARSNAFANASFRGARLSQFTVLLTAVSAEDFLDQVSSLDRVAADTRQTLDAAFAARAEAATARSGAEAAQAAAEAAKVQADAVKTAADQAATDVAARKSDLDAEVARYKQLYDTLSEQERQAAIEARERELEAQAAAAAAESEEAAAAAPPPVSDAPAAANRSRDTAAADPEPSSQQSEQPTEAAAAAEQEQTASAPAGSGKAAAAVAAALSKEGSPYVYGAAGPNSFDCSGLTSWAWKQAGVTIPRTSRGQSGLPSVPLSELQPGDLVTYYSPVSHVAMYIGNGQIIHASTSSKPGVHHLRHQRRAEPDRTPRHRLTLRRPATRHESTRTVDARAAHAAAHQRLSAQDRRNPVLRPGSRRTAAAARPRGVRAQLARGRGIRCRAARSTSTATPAGGCCRTRRSGRRAIELVRDERIEAVWFGAAAPLGILATRAAGGRRAPDGGQHARPRGRLVDGCRAAAGRCAASARPTMSSRSSATTRGAGSPQPSGRSRHSSTCRPE